MLLTSGFAPYAVLMLIALFCAYCAMKAPAPTGGLLGDHYGVQPYLYHSKVVLIFVIFSGLATRAFHRFAYLDPDLYAAIQVGGRSAFVLTLLAFIALLASAELKRRRSARSAGRA